jgi:hypothetical protein
MAARVWSQQETVNGWFKNWSILCTPYHHEFSEHQTVFGAIVVLTQLSLAANPLFHVEYNDKKTTLLFYSFFSFIVLPFLCHNLLQHQTAIVVLT